MVIPDWVVILIGQRGIAHVPNEVPEGNILRVSNRLSLLEKGAEPDLLALRSRKVQLSVVSLRLIVRVHLGMVNEDLEKHE